MQQRLSVLDRIPVPNKDPDSRLVSHHLIAYMLLSGAAETPPAFLDRQEIAQAISEAYENGTSPPGGVPFSSTLSECMGDATVTAMNQPIAFAVYFDNGNTLAVVGSPVSFYMIDPLHGIFTQTNGPEYDINDYVRQYGSEGYKIEVFSATATIPVAVAAEEPPVKKTKKSTSKKPVNGSC